MKKIIIAIAAVVFAVSACKSGGSGSEGKNMFTGNVDAQVEKLLAGKDIYADAARVIPVIVNSEQGSGEKKENLESYAIIKKGKPLTADQIKKLQTTIFATGTYDFNVQKKCMFQPYVGFIFEKDGKQAHALFCFSCNEVAFGRDGKQGNLEDFDAARKDMIALSLEAFPGDVALTKLGGK
jgi:hypothetical protein